MRVAERPRGGPWLAGCASPTSLTVEAEAEVSSFVFRILPGIEAVTIYLSLVLPFSLPSPLLFLLRRLSPAVLI